LSEYIEYLSGQFSRFGEVEIRRMFGGHGVFYHGLMFALIADDFLYFKTDDLLSKEYQAKGLTPFTYTKKNKLVKLCYYQAPDEVLEDPDEMVYWANKSFEIAVKANAETKT